jgi:DNA-binding XRE family transcriptional regulator
MTQKLADTLAKLPAERREKIETRSQELIAEYLTLKDMRKARKLTQERMAELLNIGQDSVSRLEKRSDLLLSTLAGYVKAMGGELRLVAQFPDRSPVILTGLADLDE